MASFKITSTMSFKNIILSSLVIGLVSVVFVSDIFFSTKSTVDVENIYWGKDENSAIEDSAVREFKLSLTEKEINNIYLHLNLTRLTTPLQNTTHEYGINSLLLQKLLNYLKNDYPIKQSLSKLNKYPQYITKIQGLNIYFVRIKPENITKNAKLTPILLLHGWPSSVIEYYKFAPTVFEITQKSNVNVELIIPSLPGYGYSDAPTKPRGSEGQNIATVFDNLMTRLGYNEYFVHGNDWGAVVATNMATLFPNRMKALHSNFCVSLRRISFLKMALGSLVPWWIIPKAQEGKLYPLSKLISFYVYESGYMHLQGTKPDTIGVALDNSLVGFLAFVFEKLSSAANKNFLYWPSGGIETYDLEELLDNLLFYYWLPGKATSSARLYKDNLSPDALFSDVNNIPIDPKVKCACLFFDHEFVYQPQSFLRDKYTNLVHYKTFPIGGHFVALEKESSLLLAQDLGHFIVKVENGTNFVK